MEDLKHRIFLANEKLNNSENQFRDLKNEVAAGNKAQAALATTVHSNQQHLSSAEANLTSEIKKAEKALEKRLDNVDTVG